MKVKKVICVLVSMFMLTTLLTPFAYEGIVKGAVFQGWYYKELDDGTVSITGYSYNGEAEIVIPEEIGGKRVTCIDGEDIEFFWGIDEYINIISIEIPASVTSIDSYIFTGCNRLINITVDEESATYSSEDGILYNKEKTELIKCPCGKEGSV
ncbi:MAG: leucine-rich repeat domain-containing protein, partial [Lachnospiraceae bacterium]|nr:leucine-rich repeat domain-containing protein [Lachnospiraceae bacterium]